MFDRVRNKPLKPIKVFFFFLSGISFTNHKTAGEGGGHFFNSSLPLPPASQTLRHQPGDYCSELSSAHSQQPDSKLEFGYYQHLCITNNKLYSKIFSNSLPIISVFSGGGFISLQFLVRIVFFCSCIYISYLLLKRRYLKRRYDDINT